MILALALVILIVAVYGGLAVSPLFLVLIVFTFLLFAVAARGRGSL